jgi:hypothetical protein
MSEEPGGDDGISEETREMVARIRERAALTPGATEIGSLLTSAAAKGTEMTADEIRALARDALRHAEQVSYLLGKLAGLTGDEDDP